MKKVALIVVGLMLALSGMAQDTPKLIELGLAKDLKMAFLERQLAQETGNRLQLEYENKMKQLAEQFTAANQQVQLLVDKAYADAKLDKKDFDLDPIKGEFVPVKK